MTRGVSVSGRVLVFTLSILTFHSGPESSPPPDPPPPIHLSVSVFLPFPTVTYDHSTHSSMSRGSFVTRRTLSPPLGPS